MSDTPKIPAEIRYRRDSSDNVDEAQERLTNYRQFIGETIANCSSEEMLDTLLMFVNICETAPYRHAQTPEQLKWNAMCAYSLRHVLKIMSNLSPHAPKPNVELEDQTLYYTDQQPLH